MAARAEAPSVAVLEATGEVALVQRPDGVDGPVRCAADGTWLTASGAPSEDPIRVEVASYLFQPWMHWVRLRRSPWFGGDHRRFVDADIAFRSPWEELWSDAGTFGFLDRDEGCVWVLRFPSEEGLRPCGRWRLERPDGARFDRSTVVLGYEDDRSDEVLIGDVGDGSLWRVRFEGEVPVLAEFALPGGARFEEWSGSDPVLIATAAATFAWDGVDLTPSEEEVVARDSFESALQRHGYRLDATLDGPEQWSVRVLDAQRGTPVFEHHYELGENATDRWNRTSWGIAAFGLLRPPVVALSSYFGEPYPIEYGRVSFRRSYGRDPWVAGGRNGGRVAWTLLLFAGLAWLLTRPLAKAGAGSERVAFWFVTITLGGAAALLAYGSLEALRTWAERPAVRPAAPPRLVSRPAGV